VKLIDVAPGQLVSSPELSRSGSAKQFEERLQASIEEIGLAEPIKIAPLPDGTYLVVDGTMRLRAVRSIRETDPEAFTTIPAYVVDYDRRFELRYQSDIYQDLLPSQLAVLVEHLHQAENVRKVDIARYIGVSAPTLRNYTGLWRLLERGDTFARIVELMDVEVIPSSNPYAWLRLNPYGVRKVLRESFADEREPDDWIDEMLEDARRGQPTRFPIKYVELVTSSLPANCYRKDEDVRSAKRDLGLRKGHKASRPAPIDNSDALRNLRRVHRKTNDPVLKCAAKSLQAYLG
jgi:hypothetical protein